MKAIKIMIVEDEMIVASNLAAVLERMGYEVLQPVINYTEAIELLNNESVDLAMLDIQLAGAKDGIELAQKISDDYDIPFIFLTSNSDPRTIDRAKRLNPPGYLVKPFNREDLYAAIEIALFNFESKLPQNEVPEEQDQFFIKDSIFVKHKTRFVKVKIDDIQFLKAEHVYVELYTSDGNRYLIRNSLTNFTEKLPPNFFRSHRSYTINLDHLEAINQLYII